MWSPRRSTSLIAILIAAFALIADTAVAQSKGKRRKKRPTPAKRGKRDRDKPPTPDKPTPDASATPSTSDASATPSTSDASATPSTSDASATSGTSAPPAGSPTPAKGSGDDVEIEIDPAAPAGAGSGSGGSGAAPDEVEIDMGEPEQQADLQADLADQNPVPIRATPVKKTPLSWQDIVVVIRKPFLKVRRAEFFPFVGTTMNDNLIRHYTIGGEFAYYLTDVLAIGVEGQVYAHSFREPFDLVARQARRLPTINAYNWSAALDFHYVPIYGKFAILDRRLVTWEAFFTAGIGAGQSEVIPRDTKFPGFTNFLIMPNVGVSMRFFLSKWVTVNLGIRDYVFFDHFEPRNRSETMFATAADAKAHADGTLINNIMFQIGVSFWIPPSFEYTTFR